MLVVRHGWRESSGVAPTIVVLRRWWLTLEDASLRGVGLHHWISSEPRGVSSEVLFIEEVSAVVVGACERNDEVAQCLYLRI